MKEMIIKPVIDGLAGIATFVVVRWLLELSTPAQDYQTVVSFFRYIPMYRALSFYRGLEYIHQFRGLRLLRSIIKHV